MGEWSSATHGRTPRFVAASERGSSVRCSIVNDCGGGSSGSPISSKASRRAVCAGVSSGESALPAEWLVGLV